MRINVYGHDGYPFLFFPTQNSMASNYEDMGMIRELEGYLDAGKIQIFVPDSVDLESWSDENGDKGHRAWMQEQYFQFVVNELVPWINENSATHIAPYTFGCSMGANHAAICFFRRPDLFSGVMSFSGVFTSDYFFHGWCDENLYNNSPEKFLPNMPSDHPYIDLYNQKKIILVIGQGAWEQDGLPTYRHLENVFREKGINAWVDFWGNDVKHDWDWWFVQFHYFLPYLLNEK